MAKPNPTQNLTWVEFAALPWVEADRWLNIATLDQLRDTLASYQVDGMEDDKVCDLVDEIYRMYRHGISINISKWSHTECYSELARLWQEENGDDD